MLGVSNAFLVAMYSPLIAYTGFSLAKGAISSENKEKLKNYYITKRYGIEKIEMLELEKKFQLFVKQYNLINVELDYFTKVHMEKIKRGIQFKFCIRGICEFEKLLNAKSYFNDLFLAYYSSWENDRGNVTVKAYTEKLEFEDYKDVPLLPTQLLLGFGYEGSIKADMILAPHLLISGLSGQGKTGQLRVIIKDILNRADVVMCNAFKEDFKDIKGITHIQEEDKIVDFLYEIYNAKEYRKRPLYIVLEEMMTLKSKDFVAVTKMLLAQARHWNVYFIGVVQIGTKEETKFKDLFNSRITFRQVEDSGYKTVLGSSVDEKLEKREFYTVTQKGLEKGITYTL